MSRIFSEFSTKEAAFPADRTEKPEHTVGAQPCKEGRTGRPPLCIPALFRPVQVLDLGAGDFLACSAQERKHTQTGKQQSQAHVGQGGREILMVGTEKENDQAGNVGDGIAVQRPVADHAPEGVGVGCKGAEQDAEDHGKDQDDDLEWEEFLLSEEELARRVNSKAGNRFEDDEE